MYNNSKPTLEEEAIKILKEREEKSLNKGKRSGKKGFGRSLFHLVVFLLFILFTVGAVFSFFLTKAPPLSPKNFGVTFSKTQADDLGIDWKEAYTATLSDLGARLLRIPAYWPEIEPNPPVNGEHQFDFEWLDFMMNKAASSSAEVILAVGFKLPRWPECHDPYWASDLSLKDEEAKVFDYVKETVNRYKDNPAVSAWQVENEPFLNFGVCPKLDAGFLDEEIALVKSLSDKPVLITDSGEISFWARAYSRGDIFGTTLYRDVNNKLFGQITYPLPPVFYRIKLGAMRYFYGDKPSMVVELEAEPWGRQLIQYTPLDEQLALMNPDKFREILEYTKGSGFDTFYLWGTEWWYWLKEKQNMPEMWNIAKGVIKNQDILK